MRVQLECPRHFYQDAVKMSQSLYESAVKMYQAFF